MSQAQFNLPETQVSKDVIERVQFSVSSRNAGSKVSECLTHVFVSPYSDDPSAVNWQYVSSGITCLLRKKEQSKTGRKMVWTVNMCLYSVTYGVLVWKGTVEPNSCYTAVAENFHVYIMHELNAIVGLLFEEASQAREFLRSYLQWDAEKVKDERSKGSGGTSSPSQFRKEMISKPCNFQHIQGTQALDECMEIEKIKTDIQAAFFGLASARRSTAVQRPKSAGGGSKRKKDVGKPRIQLQNICVPQRSSRGGHMIVETSKSVDVEMISALPPGRSRLVSQGSVPVGMGKHHSIPAQLALHQSQPDLLNDRQHASSIPQPQSPQYDVLHNTSNGMASPTTPHVSPMDMYPRTHVESPKYDKLPLYGKELQSPASMESAPLVQNGADSPYSPVYDGLQSTPTRAESPAYDSLQKTNIHNPPQTLTNIDHQYNPQMYVDAIVDNEVAGYTAVAGKSGTTGNSLGLDYSPPPRLSPLTFDDFSQSAFFHPTFVTSTTNC